VNSAHRSHGQPVAVGVLEVAVDEGLALLGKVADLELPGRDHHLAVVLPGPVAVDVDVDELVVEADLLKLAVDRVEGPPVPEPRLLQHLPVLARGLGREPPGRRELPLLDPGQAEAVARELDAVGDVRGFEADLVGLDPETLDAGGDDPQRQHPDGCDQSGRRQEPGRRREPAGSPEGDRPVAGPAAAAAEGDEPARRRGQRRHQEERRQPHVDVGPTGAPDRAPVGEEQVGDGEEAADGEDPGQGAEGPAQGVQGGALFEPARHRRVEGQAAVAADPLAVEVDHRAYPPAGLEHGVEHRGPGGEHRRRQGEAVEGVEQRQGEQVEAGVEPEDGLLDPGRHPVDETEDHVPGAVAPEAAGRRSARRRSQPEPPVRDRERQEEREKPGAGGAGEGAAGLRGDRRPEALAVPQGLEPEHLPPERERGEEQDRGERQGGAGREPQPAAVAQAAEREPGREREEGGEETEVHADFRLADRLPGARPAAWHTEPRRPPLSNREGACTPDGPYPRSSPSPLSP
jgi:hypothetical protein